MDSDVCNYHQLNAYISNLGEKMSIDERVLCHLIRAYRDPQVSAGVTATEMAGLVGMREHKSIGASLSRLRKKYPNKVGYTRRKGYSHGLYFFTGDV